MKDPIAEPHEATIEVDRGERRDMTVSEIQRTIAKACVSSPQFSFFTVAISEHGTVHVTHCSEEDVETKKRLIKEVQKQLNALNNEIIAVSRAKGGA